MILRFIIGAIIFVGFMLDSGRLIAGEAPVFVNGLEVVNSNGFADTTYVDAYIDTSWELKSRMPALALQYADSALLMARDLGYKNGIGNSLNLLGVIYWQISDFSQSLDYLFESFDFFEAIGDQDGMAKSASNIGIVYTDQGHYENALRYLLIALDIYEKKGIHAGHAAALNNIGMIYHHQANYARAIEYHTKSLDIKTALEDQKGIAFSLNSLGMAYQQLAEYDTALRYFYDALAIRKQLSDTREVAITMASIGYTLLSMGHEREATEQLITALRLYEEVDDRAGLARVYNLLGLLYFNRNVFNTAISHYSKSLEIVDSLGISGLILDNYLGLARSHAAQGDYSQAYLLHEKYLQIRNAFDDSESRRRVIEMQVMYDRKMKETELALLQHQHQITTLNLQKQNIIRNFLLAVIVLIGFFLLFFINRYRYINTTNRQLERSKEQIALANRKLRELISIRDKLFSIISHDLRNPFASIIGFSRVIKRDIGSLSSDELFEMVGELDASVTKINDLLENLLQWSRAQSGNVLYNPVRCSLAEVIAGNVELIAPRCKEKGIQITSDVSDSISVWADENKTNVILRNYLSNAVKFTDRGGSIHITAIEGANKVDIAVRDTGIGIREEIRSRLFKPDEFVTTYGTRDEKGSGLGLMLCKEFAERQGGEVWFTSTEGSGSTFYFSLPAAP